MKKILIRAAAAMLRAGCAQEPESVPAASTNVISPETTVQTVPT